MNLKNKISLIVSLIFTVFFAVSGTLIYVMFADFRKEEFEMRLKEKALSTIHLLVEVEQVDRQVLKIIDRNSINQLYNEKTLIFDSEFNLIYSSLDDTRITWTTTDLKYLKKNKTFFRKSNNQEVFGFFYDSKATDYYALIAATDNFGERKQEYLLIILIFTYVGFTVICWFTTSYIVKRLLLPLDLFHSRIRGINEQNLDTRIQVKTKKDEIDLLADEFNQMLSRIDVSYQRQKEFTANASHELRTPIARLTAQLENKILANQDSAENLHFFKNILEDVNQLSDVIASLLILSKLDRTSNKDSESFRMDELVYDTAEKMHKFYPDFKVSLHIDISEQNEYVLELIGIKSLMEIAVLNLLKNAYFYSSDQLVHIQIQAEMEEVSLSISNSGNVLDEDDQKRLFDPFMRGKNTQRKHGLGLGLRIVQRIINYHKGSIHYFSNGIDYNTFVVKFKNNG